MRYDYLNIGHLCQNLSDYMDHRSAEMDRQFREMISELRLSLRQASLVIYDLGIKQIPLELSDYAQAILDTGLKTVYQERRDSRSETEIKKNLSHMVRSQVMHKAKTEKYSEPIMIKDTELLKQYLSVANDISKNKKAEFANVRDVMITDIKRIFGILFKIDRGSMSFEDVDFEQISLEDISFIQGAIHSIPNMEVGSYERAVEDEDIFGQVALSEVSGYTLAEKVPSYRYTRFFETKAVRRTEAFF